jgi:hypothetical protein
MLWTSVVASLVAVAVVSVAWRFNYLRRSSGRARRHWLGALAIIEALAAVASLALALLIDALLIERNTPFTAAVTASVIALLTVVLLRVETRTDRIVRIGKQLAKPSAREAAHDQIMGLVEQCRAEKNQYDLLVAAKTLKDGRFYRDAIDVLETIELDKIHPYERELHAVVLLTARTYSGDSQRARKLLATMPALAADTTHAAVCKLMEAFVCVREGRAAEGLDLALAVDAPEVAKARHMVLAHAHAALRQDLEVGKHLEQLRDKHGDEGLRFVIDTCGPASSIATAILDPRAPYR